MTNRFSYHRPKTWDELRAVSHVGSERITYVAGGTDVIPAIAGGAGARTMLVDLRDLASNSIDVSGDGSVSIGALALMSDVAAHPLIVEKYPLVSQALLASASPQIRNMASIAGNLLQRTRCSYFRDLSLPCNKRLPGSGCPAWRGDNRRLAVFGGSEHCIATHASDLAVALSALDASVVVVTPDMKRRKVSLNELYCLPGDTPHRETTLQRDEIVASIEIPASPRLRSQYLKVRDRASFEFALVSVAGALQFENGVIREAKIALGGVATLPWRLRSVEQRLIGRQPLPNEIRVCLDGFDRDAHPLQQNGFKVELARRLVVQIVSHLGKSL